MKKQHKYWYRYRKKSRLGSIGIGIENTRLVWYRLGLGLDAKIMVSPYSKSDRTLDYKTIPVFPGKIR